MTLEEYRKKEEARIRRAEALLEAGVIVEDIHTLYIEEGVVVEAGAYLGPCVTLRGKTVIRAGAYIGQNSRIEDSEVGEDTHVESSVILESRIGSGSNIGPFAYLRPHSVIGDGCKIGDFVEVKNSNFGDGSKSAHLTYIGDADVGENVNLGCGVVFVNYDGREKHRATVGNGVFVGCNANLVSPVTVGDGAYVAAGSTVTEDIPEDALGIARSRQTNLEGWAAKKGLYRK